MVYITQYIYFLESFVWFYALLAAVDSQFLKAAWAILLSGVFDAMDGTVARMTRTSSSIGKQLDSLCDLMAFGLAPTAMAYFWALNPE
jgi:CDP-diacylglycerol--serine O-phosphatidyltransferase